MCMCLLIYRHLEKKCLSISPCFSRPFCATRCAHFRNVRARHECRAGSRSFSFFLIHCYIYLYRCDGLRDKILIIFRKFEANLCVQFFVHIILYSRSVKQFSETLQDARIFKCNILRGKREEPLYHLRSLN